MVLEPKMDSSTSSVSSMSSTPKLSLGKTQLPNISIKSDGGGEFVNTVLQNCFAAHDIFHQCSCPRTLEQNGLVERRHRHVVDTGLTLLAHAFVPLKYLTTAF